jgi:hypothetical protein
MSQYLSMSADNAAHLATEQIPEPSSLLLTALGGISLVAFLRGKRRRYGSEM